jgi:hypothetical protein
MSIRVMRVFSTVPAKDWYAKFDPGDPSLRLSTIDHPVIAWVYADYVDNDEDFPETETGWFGVGVWNDGPDYFETFSDFAGYIHRDDL